MSGYLLAGTVPYPELDVAGKVECLVCAREMTADNPESTWGTGESDAVG